MREMKDSGVEWIGEIPKGWGICRLRFLCSIATGNQDTQDNDPEGEYPFYVRSPIVEKSKNYSFEGPAILMAGDGVGAGKVFHLVDGKYGCHQRVYSLQNIHDIDRRLLYYYLQNTFYISIDTANSKSTVDSVRLPMLQDYPVPIPPADEYRCIADYLDAKCAQIDRAIARQQEVIEKLKEYKLSVITEAVTKGLNPDVPMKDSGIEWIGKIPEHWEVSKVKYVAQIQPKCSFENINPETPITYAPMECIKQGYFISNETNFGELSTSLNAFEEGDIVLAKVTPCFENGNIAIMAGIKSGIGLGSSELFVFRPTKINTKYLLHWLQNDLFKQMGCASMTGTGGLKRVSPYFIANCEIHLPPRRDQEAIVEELEKVCLSTDKATAQKLSIIDKLTEYKKSLIYEAVTGKREV